MLAKLRLNIIKLLHPNVNQIKDCPFRTNGNLVTRQSSHLPRTSACTVSPIATPVGMRANAMEILSVGENDPLVISPLPSGVCTTW